MSLDLIEIRMDTLGFNRFLGSWVYRGDSNIIVDVGPANTAGRLLETLASLGLDRIDYVLVTHIHTDHAGALADILAHFPMAQAVCHERALEYLVEPSALWAGSKKALGGIAEAYGRPRPVARDLLIPHTENPVKDMMIIETPGHAAHHLSYSYKNRLFSGEAGGNYLVVNGSEYLRPATPPTFFLDICLKSVDRLLQLEDQSICYGHFGEAESSHRLLMRYSNQLKRWGEIIYEVIEKDTNGGEGLIRRCLDALLERDPDLESFSQMDSDTQSRERFFLANSVKGFIGYLQKIPGDS